MVLGCSSLPPKLTFHSLLQHCQSVGDLSLQFLYLKSSMREKQKQENGLLEVFCVGLTSQGSTLWEQTAWLLGGLKSQHKKVLPAELLGHMGQHILNQVFLVCKHKKPRLWTSLHCQTLLWRKKAVETLPPGWLADKGTTLYKELWKNQMIRHWNYKWPLLLSSCKDVHFQMGQKKRIK